MEDKKKIGLIVTAVTVVLCGCPGLCLMVFGVLTATDSDLVNTSGNFQLLGAGMICAAVLMVLLPIGAGVYTFLQSKKESEIEDIGEIPTPL